MRKYFLLVESQVAIIGNETNKSFHKFTKPNYATQMILSVITFKYHIIKNLVLLLISVYMRAFQIYRHNIE